MRDIETIKNHLADHREQHIGKDEKPITADDIEIDVPDDKIPAVRDMFRKHEQAWSRQFVEINVTKMRIYLVSYAKPFKSSTFRAGPKTRGFKRAEFDKQLKHGINEPAMSEWAAPVVLVPK